MLTGSEEKPKSVLYNYFFSPGGNPVQSHKIIAMPTARWSTPQIQTVY